MRISSGRRQRVSFGGMLCALLVVVASIAGCTANPPPPQEVSEQQNSPARSQNSIVVAVDEIGAGFNPHLLANQTATISAVASLVLPSAFLARTDPAESSRTDWVRNEALLSAADIEIDPAFAEASDIPDALKPVVITYRIQLDAQWSDGAPIAAEDFVYLWQQMISQPGVVDPAGYRLITDVESANGGKTVIVRLQHAYPAWRQLFTDLLPSHLIKDAPGGFAVGLAERIPFSGSSFHVKSVDFARGEVLLERNDRYWGTPAEPDQILFRRRQSGAQLAESFRTNDVQLAVVTGGNGLQAQLGAIPGVRTQTLAQPRALQLVLNTRTPVMDDIRLRAAVLDLLDPDLLALAAGKGEGNSAASASLVRNPSDPGYFPSRPPRRPADDVFADLAAAGYLRKLDSAEDNELAPTPTLFKGATAVTLRIGVPQADDTAYAVARMVGDQLHGAGIAVDVVRVPPDELYGPALLNKSVDALVGWTKAGLDAPTAVASRFGCSTAAIGGTPAAPVGSTTTSETVPTGDRRPPKPVDEIVTTAPSNLAGLCDPQLTDVLERALRGDDDPAQELNQIEPGLWALHTVFPVVQDMTVVAAAPTVSGVTLTSPLPVGVFADAAAWKVAE